MRLLSVCILWLAIPLLAQSKSHVEADLLAGHSQIEKGKAFQLGVHLKMHDHWHTYFENPGFSGLPTTLNVEAVDGLEIQKLQFPFPSTFVDNAGFITYGYDKETLLIADAVYNGDADQITLQATIDWLECREQCIPGSRKVTLKLPVGKAEPAHENIFETYNAMIPQPLPAGVELKGNWEFGEEVWKAELAMTLPKDWQIEVGDQLELVPLPFEDAEMKTYQFSKKGDQLVVALTYDSFIGPAPDDLKLGAVMKLVGKDKTHYLKSQIYPNPVAGSQAAITGNGKTANADDSAELTQSSTAGFPIWLIVLMALGGGLILNLMPCVLPVLSLKVFNIIHEAGESSAKRVQYGIFYTLGVLISFLIISLIFVAAKSLGHQLNVGFQFQHPEFVIAVAAVIYILSLTFFNVFHLSGPTGGFFANLAQKGGLLGTFLQGGLMTILSTPCSAPLLGSAYAFALESPPLQLILIFQLVGFGLAFPYLLLCIAPSLMRFLPKPGPWMESFKIVMGFLMMGTVVWLLHVLAGLSGRDGVIGALIFFVGISLAAWVWGKTTYAPSKLKGGMLALVLATVSIWVGIFGVWDIRDPKANIRAYKEDLRIQILAELAEEGKLANQEEVLRDAWAKYKTTAEKIDWIPYSGQALEHFREENRIVFLDFTADWCLTCKSNEKLVINTKAVREALAEYEVVTIKVDYTDKDDEITAFIQSFDRAGVPLYVIYPGTGDPILLPEIIQTGIVLDALQEAGGLIGQRSAL